MPARDGETVPGLSRPKKRRPFHLVPVMAVATAERLAKLAPPATEESIVEHGHMLHAALPLASQDGAPLRPADDGCWNDGAFRCPVWLRHLCPEVTQQAPRLGPEVAQRIGLDAIGEHPQEQGPR